MSDTNPYSPTQHRNPINDFGIRIARVRPIQLMKRSYDLIGDQYWLFFGITLVGVLLGSAVPFGLILGPMLVGIYLCYIDRERGQRTEFSTLFRGFDYFLESFLAILILIAVSIVVMAPFVIAFLVMIWTSVSAGPNPGNARPAAPQLPIGIFILYPIMLIANIAIYLPFVFTFQLIADRNLKALDAVKMSVRGVFRNLFGVIWLMFVLGIVSMILTLMCYVPVFLFMPISFGALFVLYRDIFEPVV